VGAGLAGEQKSAVQALLLVPEQFSYSKPTSLI
jgi:hypothetical protein